MSSAGAIRAGRAFVELFADDSQLKRGLTSAQRRLQLFGRQTQAIGQKMLAFGSMVGAPLALSLKVYADFEDQLSKVKAVSAGTAEQFEHLRDVAKELGRTTSFTAAQVASGMVELGRAGFDRTEIDQSIKAMLDLSRAADTELPEATAIAGATLRQFNLPASEMTRVADVLSATANGSAQTLIDLGESMKYVAPLAVEAGESLESTSASLAILANNGIKGSVAGTALARAYKNIAGGKAAKFLKELKIEAVDAAGNIKPLAVILEELNQKTAGMGTGAKLAIFDKMFGRAAAAQLKLTGNAANFASVLDKIVNSQGNAAMTAEEMDNNLGGSFRELLSAIEGVAIALGEALAPKVSELADKVGEIALQLTDWIGKNKELVVQGAMLVATITAIGAGLVVVGTAIHAIGSAIGIFTKLTSLAGSFGMLLTPQGMILAGLAAVAAGLIAIQQQTGVFTPLIEDLKAELLPTLIELGTELKDTVQEALQVTLDLVKLLNDEFGEFAMDLIISQVKLLALELKVITGAITGTVKALTFALKEARDLSSGSIVGTLVTGQIPIRKKKGADQSVVDAISGTDAAGTAPIGGLGVAGAIANIAAENLANPPVEPSAEVPAADVADTPGLLSKAIDSLPGLFDKLKDLPGELKKATPEPIKDLIKEISLSAQGFHRVDGKKQDPTDNLISGGGDVQGTFSALAGRMFGGSENLDAEQLRAMESIDDQMRMLVNTMREAMTYGT